MKKIILTLVLALYPFVFVGMEDMQKKEGEAQSCTSPKKRVRLLPMNPPMAPLAKKSRIIVIGAADQQKKIKASADYKKIEGKVGQLIGISVDWFLNVQSNPEQIDTIDQFSDFIGWLGELDNLSESRSIKGLSDRISTQIFKKHLLWIEKDEHPAFHEMIRIFAGIALEQCWQAGKEHDHKLFISSQKKP